MPDGKLALHVVSPSEMLFDGEVSSLVIPAWDGKVGILSGHAPYIALLGVGMLDANLVGGGSESFFVRRGVAKVDSDRVTVLSEFAASEAPDNFSLGEACLDPDEIAEATENGEAPEPVRHDDEE